MPDAKGLQLAPKRSLRVLLAGEDIVALGALEQIVTGLGHEVIAQELEADAAGVVTARELPDVALVGLGPSQPHALALIERIVHESACPVIALLPTEEPAYLLEAARLGVFAFVVDTTPGELQSSIDLTLQRFAAYHDLQGAFGRRAVIEQAKGILMAHHSLDEDGAFALLREHSQRGTRKLGDVAASIVDVHVLLAPSAALRGARARDAHGE
jgi:response regulator NasT